MRTDAGEPGPARGADGAGATEPVVRPPAARREFARGVLVVAAIVLLSTGLSPMAIPQVIDQQDKLHHVAGFFVFAWALRGAFPWLGTGATLAAGAGVALALEATQLLLPLRTASLGDVAAGVIGVVLGCAAGARRSRGAAQVAARPPDR